MSHDLQYDSKETVTERKIYRVVEMNILHKRTSKTFQVFRYNSWFQHHLKKHRHILLTKYLCVVQLSSTLVHCWSSSSEEHFCKFKHNLQEKHSEKRCEWCIQWLLVSCTRDFFYLYSDEDDYHPLQPEAVLLAQVTPHQVCQLCAMLQLLVHNLKTKCFRLWSETKQVPQVPPTLGFHLLVYLHLPCG